MEATAHRRSPASRLAAIATELRLTPIQRRFAEALASDPERNQTRAARAAGAGKDAAVRGAKLVRLGKVGTYLHHLSEEAQARIERETERTVGDAAKVIRGLWDIVNSSVVDFLRYDPPGPRCIHCGRRGASGLFVDPREVIEQGKGAEIKRLKFWTDGGSIELYDRVKALGMLARVYGLYDGRHQHEKQRQDAEHWQRALAKVSGECIKELHLALLDTSRPDERPKG
jgi:Terminase small subunit